MPITTTQIRSLALFNAGYASELRTHSSYALGWTMTYDKVTGAVAGLLSRRRRRRFLMLMTFWMFINLQAAMAQAQTVEQLTKLPPMVDEPRGLLVARPFTVGSNVTAGVLRLPDGSVIRTVWPAALEKNSQDVSEPVWPRCEPAVYSLARVMPDGKELWAKSYVYYWKGNLKYEECASEVWGFSIRSPLGEVTAPGYYEIKYGNRVFIGEPNDARTRLILNPDTGDVMMDKPPTNLRVIDAYELKALKERIGKEIESKLPPTSTKNLRRNERIYKVQLFKRLEKVLFPKPPSSKP